MGALIECLPTTLRTLDLDLRDTSVSPEKWSLELQSARQWHAKVKGSPSKKVIKSRARHKQSPRKDDLPIFEPPRVHISQTKPPWRPVSASARRPPVLGTCEPKAALSSNIETKVCWPSATVTMGIRSPGAMRRPLSAGARFGKRT